MAQFSKNQSEDLLSLAFRLVYTTRVPLQAGKEKLVKAILTRFLTVVALRKQFGTLAIASIVIHITQLPIKFVPYFLVSLVRAPHHTTDFRAMG